MYPAHLGPGQTVDLAPPSPTGVDVLYSDDYVAQQTREGNSYAYCNNNPVNSIDPSGLKPTKWEVYCRPVIIPRSKRIVHCYIVCDGHTYSMVPEPIGLGGRIVVHEDAKFERDRRGRLKGTKRALTIKGHPDMCKCLQRIVKAQPKFRLGSYNESDCNSNYFMETMALCCDPDAEFVLRPLRKQLKPHGIDKCTIPSVQKKIIEMLRKAKCNNKRMQFPPEGEAEISDSASCPGTMVDVASVEMPCPTSCPSSNRQA